MDFLPLLHISAATVGLFSGYLAMLVRKGAGLHRLAGSVFVVSMLAMSGSAAYLAGFVRPNRLNVVAALLTFYLVATAWWAGRRREGSRGPFEVAALLLVIAAAVIGIASGPPAAVFGSIAALFAVSDLRAFVRGGITGPRRITRHLWRMSLALLIATLSLYPGQAKLFSQPVRDTGLLFTPHLFLVVSMLFWMIHVRRRGNARRAETSEHHVSRPPMSRDELPAPHFSSPARLPNRR